MLLLGGGPGALQVVLHQWLWPAPGVLSWQVGTVAVGAGLEGLTLSLSLRLFPSSPA